MRSKWIKMIWKYRRGKFAFGTIGIFLFIGLFADFIANDKPLFCKFNGKSYFPVCHDFGESLGIVKPYPFIKMNDWKELDLAVAVNPIIPFKPSSQNKVSKSYAPPLSNTIIRGKSYIHLFGTDKIGRDIAAGIVHGCRIGMLVGLISMGIAMMIGIFLGAVAGYFGDTRLTFNLLAVPIFILLFSLIIFYVIFLPISSILLKVALFIVLNILLITIAKNLDKYINKRYGNRFQKALWLDLLIMRMVEVFRSIPSIFILLAILSIIQKPSIYYVIIIIGFLKWPGITRLVRAEFLKIREQNYIKAVQNLGFHDMTIIWRHGIPNALPPILVALAFGFSNSILLEASVSFLGIGLGPEEVTWGSIFRDASRNMSAWWLVIFPGIAIFLMIYSWNLLGEIIDEISDPTHRKI